LTAAQVGLCGFFMCSFLEGGVTYHTTLALQTRTHARIIALATGKKPTVFNFHIQSSSWLLFSLLFFLNDHRSTRGVHNATASSRLSLGHPFNGRTGCCSLLFAFPSDLFSSSSRYVVLGEDFRSLVVKGGGRKSKIYRYTRVREVMT
jgi:hypothetical protein